MPRLIRVPELTAYIFDNEATIGRSLNCSYILDDPTVSRMHCRILKIDDKWHVADMSTNGLLINKRTAGPREIHPLENRDCLTIGRFQFCFTLDTVGDCYSALYDDSDVLLVENQPREDIVDEMPTNEKPIELSNSIVVGDNLPDPPRQEIEAEIGNGNKVPSNLSEELLCSICLELFITAMTLNCSHTFCATCIQQWSLSNTVCPICRVKITTCTRSVTIDNVVQRVVESQPPEVQLTHQNEVASRKTQNLAKPSAIRNSRSSRGRGNRRRRSYY